MFIYGCAILMIVVNEVEEVDRIGRSEKKEVVWLSEV